MKRTASILVAGMLLAAACGGDGAEDTTTTTVAETSTTSSTVTTTTLATTSTTEPETTTTPPSSVGATDTIYVVQADLQMLGYFDGVIDGIAGEETRAAITAFQTDAGIEADGEFGPVTDGELYPLLRANTEYVEMLQEQLAELEYYTGPIDGDFGAGTEAAVQRAQAACELEETGEIDIATRLCLFAP